jgi:anthranilate phosphoribosyltransferase
MKREIEAICDGKILSVDEARELLHRLVGEEISSANIAALLTALRCRGLTVELLEGFSRGLLDLAVPIDLGGTEFLDLCGTGGDGKRTFNISTTMAFVVAAAGYRVAKHGNNAVSSSCGSSNVLQALGVPLHGDVDKLRRCFERSGICFIHAPLFHPALKRVAPARQELGFRTIFNALGPLVNPARPHFQLSGVYSLELQRLYAYLLQRQGNRFAVIHTLDGHDEVSLTAPTRVRSSNGEEDLTAGSFGLPRVRAEELIAPDSVDACARLVVDILEGRGTPAQEAAVVANAALVMRSYDGKGELLEYVERARAAIKNGAARAVLTRVREGV